MRDLFAFTAMDMPGRQELTVGAALLNGQVLADEDALLAALDTIVAQAPFRHMTTPGGFVMSVAMTSCGAVGWVTDRSGYRYEPCDPQSSLPWPQAHQSDVSQGIVRALRSPVFPWAFSLNSDASRGGWKVGGP